MCVDETFPWVAECQVWLRGGRGVEGRRRQQVRWPGQTGGTSVMLSLPLHFSGSQTSSIVTRF